MAQAQTAFDHLKEALSTTSVLALSDFERPFTIKTDTSDIGMGTVISQQGHPIAFFSKPFSPKLLSASTYVCELCAVTSVVKKWCQYLLGHHFTIITDHHSLKELLSQTIQTLKQHMYLVRLMGYNYNIKYRSSVHNQAADALSRLPKQNSSMTMILSVPCLTFLEELRHQLDNHSGYIHQCRAILESLATHPEFSISLNLVLHKGRIWLPRELPMISTLLTEYHTTPTGGHTGVAKTITRLSENFYWLGLREDVTQFVANWVECQLTKYETKKLAGLLCHLSVPYCLWENLSLDFIVGLPSYHGSMVILVVVDCFSKGIHLGMLPPLIVLSWWLRCS